MKIQDYIFERGESRINRAQYNVNGFYFEDFATLTAGGLPPGWTATDTEDGTGAPAADVSGGVAELQSSATTASAREIETLGPIIANPITNKWYAAFRVKFLTANDGDTTAYVGLKGVTDNYVIAFGCFGSELGELEDPLLFRTHHDEAIGSGTFTTFGDSDDSWHTVEFYNPGDGIIRVMLDEGTPVELEMDSEFAYDEPACLVAFVGNGAGTSEEVVQIDWAAAVYPR